LTEDVDTRTGIYSKWRTDVWTGLEPLAKMRKKSVNLFDNQLRFPTLLPRGYLSREDARLHFLWTGRLCCSPCTWPYSLMSTLFTVPSRFPCFACQGTLQCHSAVTTPPTAALTRTFLTLNTSPFTSVSHTNATAVRWVRHLPVLTIYVLLAGCASLSTEDTPPAACFRYEIPYYAANHKRSFVKQRDCSQSWTQVSL
jgi:hypothetical protein